MLSAFSELSLCLVAEFKSLTLNTRIDFYLFRSFAAECKSVSCNAVWS